jgi:hypothetical protein
MKGVTTEGKDETTRAEGEQSTGEGDILLVTKCMEDGDRGREIRGRVVWR